MDKQQQAFYAELIADFKIEAAEHRDLFTKNLLELEKAEIEDSKQLNELMFREMHSLKGAARAVNLGNIESLCQAAENIMSLLKTDSLEPSGKLFDGFHSMIDLLDDLLQNLEKSEDEENSHNVRSVVDELTSLAKGEEKKVSRKPSFKDLALKMKAKASLQTAPSLDLKDDAAKTKSEDIKIPNIKKEQQETIRISTQRLNFILRKAEELIIAKAMLADEQIKLETLREKHLQQNKLGEQCTQILTKFGKSDDVALLEENLFKQQEHAKEIQQQFREVQATSQYKTKSISRMIDDLLIDIKTTLLVPFSSLTDMLPKTVRNLAKDMNKSVSLNISGSEVEIDRRILEQLKDPVLHLIRNCVDHGIEPDDERIAQSKPAKASINITIGKTEDRRVVVQISDDGAGINLQKVIHAAVRNNIATQEAINKMPVAEQLKLIFRSGISTSTTVSTISGRGLGMAIVAEKVEGLGGNISIASELGKGTTFTISLPLTLATFKGVMVRCADQIFMLNTTTVERVLRLKHSEIRTVNDKEAIVLNGETIGLVSLASVLEIQKPTLNEGAISHLSVLVLSIAQKRVAFVVDEILGQQEGIVKELGPLLPNVKNINGATILGNGKVVPVLNTSDLIKNIENTSSINLLSAKNEKEENGEKRKRILVAEDSLTSRSLLRNILEVADYDVKTAIDGAEAYRFLLAETFDLLVSDIEMPNLDGIDLVKKIRKTEQIRTMPVVLITSLNTPEDKQRGLNAGADAYFIKSSFDQTNLVKIIQQLI